MGSHCHPSLRRWHVLLLEVYHRWAPCRWLRLRGVLNIILSCAVRLWHASIISHECMEDSLAHRYLFWWQADILLIPWKLAFYWLVISTRLRLLISLIALIEFEVALIDLIRARKNFLIIQIECLVDHFSIRNSSRLTMLSIWACCWQIDRMVQVALMELVLWGIPALRMRALWR